MEELEGLIKDYERRLRNVEELLSRMTKDEPMSRVIRLETRVSCYKMFLGKLKRNVRGWYEDKCSWVV